MEKLGGRMQVFQEAGTALSRCHRGSHRAARQDGQ